jgi:hypothetical protein
MGVDVVIGEREKKGRRWTSRLNEAWLGMIIEFAFY